MILGQIRAAAGQLRPDARARRALSAVLDADLALKTSRGDPRHVLECLVVELCGAVLERPAWSASRQPAAGGAIRRWWP